MAGSFRSFVVVNPKSANGSTERLWPKIEAALAESLGPFEHAFTTRPGEATDLARLALEGGAEMVVSVGGDGTHNEVLNGFLDEDKPVGRDAVLGLVSRGTGCDFIKTVDLPKDYDEAARCLAGRATIPCDVGKMTFTTHDGREAVRYFLNIGDFGFGGEVAVKVNSTTKALGGFFSFYMGSLRALFAYRNKPCRVSLDDGPEEEMNCFEIVAANGRYFGGGMLVAPEARIDDGLLEFVLMEDFRFWDTLLLSRRIYRGELGSLGKVRYARGKKLRASSPEEVLIDLDGEQPGRLPLTFEILPRAVKIKVP